MNEQAAIRRAQLCEARDAVREFHAAVARPEMAYGEEFRGVHVNQTFVGTAIAAAAMDNA